MQQYFILLGIVLILFLGIFILGFGMYKILKTLSDIADELDQTHETL